MLNEINKSKFGEQRRLLIESLRIKGNIDEKVLNAMMQLPREEFIIPAFASRAYEDTALPIAANQTISQPYTVAVMTSILRFERGDKILEIGTGSGYQACLLYLLGAKVFTVERIPELYESSKMIFKKFNMSINSRLADGTLGWKDFSPYSGIIVTASAPDVPKNLVSQLTIGGRMVIPIGDRSSQDMVIITRVDELHFEEKRAEKFKFVPLIGKEGWDSE